jgi:uncharacterized membrane protein
MKKQNNKSIIALIIANIIGAIIGITCGYLVSARANRMYHERPAPLERTL